VHRRQDGDLRLRPPDAGRARSEVLRVRRPHHQEHVVRLVLVAAVVSLAFAALATVRTSGHALNEGDEPTLAEYAREMQLSGDVLDLRWQGDVQIIRPPMVPWI